jgi:hypothetical protein
MLVGAFLVATILAVWEVCGVQAPDGHYRQCRPPAGR